MTIRGTELGRSSVDFGSLLGPRTGWASRDDSRATFGHFGGPGTMMWFYPTACTSPVALADRRFELWSAAALRLWPQRSDAVLAWDP